MFSPSLFDIGSFFNLVQISEHSHDFKRGELFIDPLDPSQFSRKELTGKLAGLLNSLVVEGDKNRAPG